MSPSLFVSVAVHAVAIALLVVVLSVPSTLVRFFDRNRGDIPAERVGMIALPSSTQETVAGRAGGDGRPLRSTPRQRDVVAPAAIPVGIPEPSRAAVEGGSGPLIGTGGPAQGIRPAYRDARLWREPRQIVSAPRSVREDIQSIIAADIGPIADSLRTASARRSPRDWTFNAGGHRWGLDSSFIRLGPVSIPTAVLAMLPVNAQANPIQLERDRALDYMSRDINWHARRAISEDEFRRQVRNLRERKERERAERAGNGTNEERRTDSPAAPSRSEANY